MNDEYVIELETNSERIIIPPENIIQCFQNKDSEDLLTIVYKVISF